MSVDICRFRIPVSHCASCQSNRFAFFTFCGCERNDKALRKWMDEEYPAIAKKAAAEDAEAHWGDETGIKCNDDWGRGFAPKAPPDLNPDEYLNGDLKTELAKRPERHELSFASCCKSRIVEAFLTKRLSL